MHSLPPNAEFSLSQSYIISLLAIPLLLLLLSVLILFFFLVFVFFRFLKGKCCPNTKIPFLKSIHEISSMYLEPDFEKRKYHYRYSILAFFLFLFAALIANTLIYVGSVQMTNSLQSTSDAFNVAANIFFGLAYYTSQLGIGLNNVTEIASSYPCNDALAYAQNDSPFNSETQTV